MKQKRKALKTLLCVIVALMMCAIVSHAEESIELNLGETRQMSIVDDVGKSLVWQSSNTNIVTCSGQASERTDDSFKRNYTCDLVAQATGQAIVTVVDEFSNTTIQTIYVTVSKYRAVQCVDEKFQIGVTSTINQTFTISCPDGAEVSSRLVGTSSVTVGSYTKYGKTYEVSVAEAGEHTLKITGSSGSTLVYEVNILNHNWGNEIVQNPATCTTNGTNISVCTRCKKVKTIETTALGHDYSTSWTVDKEPTCTTEGTRSRHCARCDSKIDIQSISVVDHDMGDWEVAVPATCTSHGQKIRKCTDCGKILEEGKIDALGHTPNNEWEIDTQATCESDGVKVKKCITCKAVLETEKINFLGHDMGDWETVIIPNCKNEGKQVKKCTRCENQEEKTLPKTDHTAGSWETVKAATCNAEGTQAKKCTVCGTVMETKTIPKNAVHTWTPWNVTKEATVFAGGMESRSCSVCGKTENRNTEKLVATIKVNVSSIPLKVKQFTNKVAVTELANGDYVKSWASSNTKIATVNKKGKITGKKTGKAIITVTLASGKKAKINVTVQKRTVKTAKITGLVSKVTLNKRKTLALKPVLQPITSVDKISYTTSNKKVATVSSKGVITAKGAGTAKITVKAGNKKYVVKVAVPKTATTEIKNVKTSITLKRKKSYTLKPKLNPTNSDEKITYTSSNKKVAAVSSKGKITAKAKGKAVITVKSGKISVKCKVTVK